HLEILSRMRFLSLGIVECVNHRCSVKRPLRGSVDAFWERQTRSFQNRRRKFSYVSELRTNLSLGLYSRRPVDDNPVSSATVMRRDLLGPLERGIAGPCPAESVMRKGCWVSPVIQMRHVNLGGADDPIQRHHLVICAFRSTLGARTVITRDVDK